MSKIEYVDKSWNPITGCNKISLGCKNCWAEKMARRLKGMGVKGYGRDFNNIMFHPYRLNIPNTRKKPTRYDVCFMGDIFHDNVYKGWQREVFKVMIKNDRHTFLILTKRPQNMRDYLHVNYSNLRDGLPNNIWLGISIEDQMAAKTRLAYFNQILHKNLWISYEPALEYVDFTGYEFIKWMVIGGESGAGKRPVNIEWLRSASDWCKRNKIPLFIKQIDKIQPIPKDLRIFEIPEN